MTENEDQVLQPENMDPMNEEEDSLSGGIPLPSEIAEDSFDSNAEDGIEPLSAGSTAIAADQAAEVEAKDQSFVKNEQAKVPTDNTDIDQDDQKDKSEPSIIQPVVNKEPTVDQNQQPILVPSTVTNNTEVRTNTLERIETNSTPVINVNVTDQRPIEPNESDAKVVQSQPTVPPVNSTEQEKPVDKEKGSIENDLLGIFGLKEIPNPEKAVVEESSPSKIADITADDSNKITTDVKTGNADSSSIEPGKPSDISKVTNVSDQASEEEREPVSVFSPQINLPSENKVDKEEPAIQPSSPSSIVTEIASRGEDKQQSNQLNEPVRTQGSEPAQPTVNLGKSTEDDTSEKTVIAETVKVITSQPIVQAMESSTSDKADVMTPSQMSKEVTSPTEKVTPTEKEVINNNQLASPNIVIKLTVDSKTNKAEGSVENQEDKGEPEVRVESSNPEADGAIDGSADTSDVKVDSKPISLTKDLVRNILTTPEAQSLKTVNANLEAVQHKLDEATRVAQITNTNTSNLVNSSSLVVNNEGAKNINQNQEIQSEVKKPEETEQSEDSGNSMMEFYLHGIYDALVSQGIRIKSF